jgi:predicted nucleotidyltransferase
MVGVRLYAVLARAAAIYLRRGRREAAVYADRGQASGDLIPGLSDIDLVAVVPDDPTGGLQEHRRLKRRWERARRLIPLVAGRLFGDMAIYEEGELRSAVDASMLTSGLRDGDPGTWSAVLFGTDPPHDESQLRLRPGLAPPTAAWRLISGPEIRPPIPARGRHDLRIAAWLELQWWWRTAFGAIADPARPWTSYSCVKMVSEPARIWLGLADQPTDGSRAETLDRAAEHLPEMAGPISEAQDLLRALPRSPEPPLRRFLGHLISFSELIAEQLVAEVDHEDFTSVRLAGEPGELMLPGRPDPVGLLPLLDWRALVAPSLPDEALRLSPELTPERVIDGASVRSPAVYPALRDGQLIALPVSDVWRRGILRAVQMPLTDPVSFAQADGAETAEFPEVDGWSARDWAGRAVGEHTAWLARYPADQLGAPTAREWLDGEASAAAPATRAVAKLLTAARAALFHESLRVGRPELPLTVAATCARLGEIAGAEGESVAGEARDAYRAARVDGEADAAEDVFLPLRAVVLGLPAYAGVASAG